MHILLDSYVCHNPESEDLFGVKGENQTNCPCYCCLLIESDLNKSKIESICVGGSRRLDHILRILKLQNCYDSETKETLKDVSMLPINPV